MLQKICDSGESPELSTARKKCSVERFCSPLSQPSLNLFASGESTLKGLAVPTALRRIAEKADFPLKVNGVGVTTASVIKCSSPIPLSEATPDKRTLPR
ncbi:hypothetical protein KCP76_13650 [Salmonella enterica subsp. enterica serovar Weltevreden]|nr:hypothetical protein KCP76_13650 [Salmonella enterica subsp. enterica serovar Weltevreden]